MRGKYNKIAPKIQSMKINYSRTFLFAIKDKNF